MAGFNSSFASARKAGKSTFTWNGKSYNTKLASGSSGASLPKTTTATPTSRSDAVTSKATSRPSFSGLSDVASNSKKTGRFAGTTSDQAAARLPKSGNAPFLPMTKMSNMSDLNDFRQKESHRASDESTKNITGSSLKGAWNSVANKNKYKF